MAKSEGHSSINDLSWSLAWFWLLHSPWFASHPSIMSLNILAYTSLQQHYLLYSESSRKCLCDILFPTFCEAMLPIKNQVFHICKQFSSTAYFWIILLWDETFLRSETVTKEKKWDFNKLKFSFCYKANSRNYTTFKTEKESFFPWHWQIWALGNTYKHLPKLDVFKT